jgi:hypothetical protein
MTKYFFMAWAADNDETGIAWAPEGTPAPYEFISKLEGVDELPFDLEIRDGILEDYPGNSLAWPLMSEKMKRVIERNLTGEEGVSWIKANVKAGGDLSSYYILRFRKKMDVLDMDRTTFVSGTDKIIEPCFSLAKIQRYSLFHKPASYDLWKITVSIYVNDKLRKEMIKEGLSGVAFSEAKVI